MPSGTIVERSALLTPRGWKRCGHTSAELEVVGLDRAGTPQACRVHLRQSSTRSRVAFVGTAAAAGEFSETSRLLLATGNAVDLRQVIATGSASELQFETFRIDSQPSPSREQMDALWEELRILSAIDKEECFVIKCIQDNAPVAKRCHAGWLKCVEDLGTRYCVIARERIAESLRADADKTLIALANLCFFRDSEKRWEIESDSTLLAMWLMDALRRAGVNRALQYDSLQHSCFLFIDSGVADPPPLGPGRCAFLSSRVSREMRIEWSDPSWTPVISGFLLSPEVR